MEAGKEGEAGPQVWLPAPDGPLTQVLQPRTWFLLLCSFLPLVPFPLCL